MLLYRVVNKATGILRDQKAGEMARWVRHVLCKQKDQSLDLQPHHNFVT